MLTEFGKELRKLRIDNEETLANMAAKLGVSSSFLSAVEKGKKSLPKELIGKISNVYNLEQTKRNDLEKAALLSVPVIKIELKNTNKKHRELAVNFSEKFRSLTDKECEMILQFLNQNP